MTALSILASICKTKLPKLSLRLLALEDYFAFEGRREGPTELMRCKSQIFLSNASNEKVTSRCFPSLCGETETRCDETSRVAQAIHQTRGDSMSNYFEKNISERLGLLLKTLQRPFL